MASEHPFERAADLAQVFDHAHALGFESAHLFLRPALRTGNDRAGVSHALALGSGRARDERRDLFFHMLLDIDGRLLFLAAPDLSDHHDGPGLGILFEKLQDLDEPASDPGIPADADA